MYFIALCTYVIILLKMLDIPNSAWPALPPSPLAHTLYHSPMLGDQRLFMHHFNISTIIHVTLTTFPKCSAPLSSCIPWTEPHLNLRWTWGCCAIILWNSSIRCYIHAESHCSLPTAGGFSLGGGGGGEVWTGYSLHQKRKHFSAKFCCSWLYLAWKGLPFFKSCCKKEEFLPNDFLNF